MAEGYEARVEQLVKKFAAVCDPFVLERLAMEFLSQRPVELLAELLSSLGRLTLQEEYKPAYVAVVRCCLAFGEEIPRSVREGVYNVLAGRGESCLVRYLLPVRAVREGDGEELRHDPQLEQMTLGMKRWKARSHDRDLLLRLAKDSDLGVLANLLENPRITENDVVLWAAKRPNDPQRILVIACHRKWSLRPRVQEAIARNPYSPVHVAASFLPLFPTPLLKKVWEDPSLHPLCREAAIEISRLRRGSNTP